MAEVLPNLKKRDTALDVFRTLAVLGMMATHTTRLVVREARWSWNVWALLLEPIIPALFLALVGASLVLSYRSRKADARLWGKRQLRRAFYLWLVGVVFYLAESGFQWPDVFFSPGILGTIGYGILLIALPLALASPGKSFMLLSAIGLLGVSVYLYFDFHERMVFWINSGNSPALPLLLFALLGAMAAHWGNLFGRRGRVTLGLLAAGIAVFIVWKVGAHPLFSKPLGRSDATRVFVVLQQGVSQEKVMGYYNLRPILSLWVACFLITTWEVLCVLRPLLSRLGPSWFAIGRHSLGVYILHLSLLAIPFVWGGAHPFKQGWMGLAVWLGLMAICQGYAQFREKTTKTKNL